LRVILAQGDKLLLAHRKGTEEKVGQERVLMMCILGSSKLNSFWKFKPVVLVV